MSDRKNDWYVSIPLSDLEKLRADSEYLNRLETEHKQLRSELDGLRGMFSELMTAFGELRREIMKGLAPFTFCYRASHMAGTGDATTT